MKRYKDCALKCLKNQSTSELLELVERICGQKSYRTEKNNTWANNDTLVVYVEKESLPLSRIIIVVRQNEQKLDIVNIVPSKKSGLSSLDYTQYNTILDTFRDDVFLEIKNKYSNEIEENNEDYTIQEIIPKSFDKFNLWLNMYPLSGHPLDEHRWFDFLIALRENDESLSVSDFSKYIEEKYGWSEDDLERFELKYEEQIDLLEYYDEHRGY